jgi:hypothetical protein
LVAFSFGNWIMESQRLLRYNLLFIVS